MTMYMTRSFVFLNSTGGPFNVMSRRVLGTNGHLAEELSGILSKCPLAEGEPKPLS